MLKHASGVFMLSSNKAGASESLALILVCVLSPGTLQAATTGRQRTMPVTLYRCCCSGWFLRAVLPILYVTECGSKLAE